MKKMNQKGFTLAELLIVVAVIAVLVAVAIPTFSNQLEKSRQAVDVSNLRGAYAAGRLAEMEGSVDNVKFSNYARNDLNVGNPAAADTTRYYACYWYDPDNGKLNVIDPTNDVLKAQTAEDHFGKTSQKGKAQGIKVLVDTSQLPGEGKNLIVYQDEQLQTATGVTKTGTVQRAIRVTFYRTEAGPFKLHEISFVAKADEALVNKGTEDIIKISSDEGGTTVSATENNNGSTNYTLDLSGLYVNKEKIVLDNYTVLVAVDDTDNFDSTAPAIASGTLTAKLNSSLAANKTGVITLTFISKADPSVTGTFKITLTKTA